MALRLAAEEEVLRNCAADRGGGAFGLAIGRTKTRSRARGTTLGD